MNNMELKVGERYYLTDLSYHDYLGEYLTYEENRHLFTHRPLKLIEIGEYPHILSGNKPMLNEWGNVYMNDVKLLDEETGIILISNSEFLSKDDPNEMTGTNEQTMRGEFDDLCTFADELYTSIMKSDYVNSMKFDYKDHFIAGHSILDNKKKLSEMNVREMDYSSTINKLKEKIDNCLDTGDREGFKNYSKQLNRLESEK